MQGKPVAFTTTYTGLSSVLQSKVHICLAFNPSNAPTPLTTQSLGANEYIAIWDTGATNCVVTQKVVDDCGLKPTGMAMVNTANGERLTPTYLVALFLPNTIAIPSLRVTTGIIAGDAELLIGMDVISQGDFAVTNVGGATAFSFRMPSMERIDFVKQTQEPSQPGFRGAGKIGRNQPCPCGSGKKYKYCHGRQGL